MHTHFISEAPKSLLTTLFQQLHYRNWELLKAPNKQDYKRLRWEGTFPEWQKISNTLTEDDFKWWVEFVRDNKGGYDLPERLNRYGTANKFIKVRQKLMSLFPKVSKRFNNYDKVFLTYVAWVDIENLRENGLEPVFTVRIAF
jgi:hypothetical protein